LFGREIFFLIALFYQFFDLMLEYLDLGFGLFAFGYLVLVVHLVTITSASSVEGQNRNTKRLSETFQSRTAFC